MTHRLLIAALLMSATTAPFGMAVHAQVSVNNNALDALGKPAAPAERHRAREHEPAHRAVSHGKTAGGEKPAATARPAPPAHAPIVATPLPPIPVTPPNVPAIPPAAAIVPVRPPPPLPTIPMVADAPGAAAKIDDGMRVTFGPDHADLNPATVASLRILGHAALNSPGAPINVAAYAAGTPEDPSTPRRLSLSRALAVRAVLVNEGIPSTRIYVRALGTNDPGGGPPDRVDVTIGAPADPAQSSGGQAAPPGAKPRTTATP